MPLARHQTGHHSGSPQQDARGIQLHRPEPYPDAFMISAILRRAIRLALMLVAAAIAFVVLFVAVAGIARYEQDGRHCPDAPLAELEAKILTFVNAYGIDPDEIEFIGMPRYHADTLGWWGFDLKSRKASYVATIDCEHRVTGFGKIQMFPLEPATPTQ
ncbi:hypothetical protein [Burkholderia ubonensis]|uniref:hypothetical protein n=1 Tax=Burkholderia ubonensis TaxID=101571 RepID=UPI000A5752FD|nr:hypothetical protein [Burkholderia ubonensis]